MIDTTTENPEYFCSTCSKKLVWVDQIEKWYCDYCEEVTYDLP